MLILLCSSTVSSNVDHAIFHFRSLSYVSISETCSEPNHMMICTRKTVGHFWQSDAENLDSIQSHFLCWGATGGFWPHYSYVWWVAIVLQKCRVQTSDQPPQSSKTHRAGLIVERKQATLLLTHGLICCLPPSSVGYSCAL